MDPLAQIHDWPAAHAAVTVVTTEGTVAEAGDSRRPFKLASVTKPLVAAAVLVAHEEGSLDLDEPAGPAGSTVRHLLAHASGLPFEGDTPLRPPATRRVYSNIGFEILGDVLARRTGIDVATYMYEAVCEPLGMTTTRLAGSPAYGAVACAGDLSAFCTELLAPGRILSAATVADATTVQFPGLRGIVPGYGRQLHNDWGLGFELRDAKEPHWTGTSNSPHTFGHFGQAGTFVWVDPAASVACVCLTDQTFGDWARQAWPRLADSVLTAFGSISRHEGTKEPHVPSD